MDIEKNIFKNAIVDFDKLIDYGFIKEVDDYIYTKNILDNDFKVIISINKDKNITGKIIDLDTNYEYSNIKVKSINGEFIDNMREEYQNILVDIKDKCFHVNTFNSIQAKRISDYIHNTYHDKPVFLWEKYPDFGVFRNKNNKWYAIFMNIDYSKLDKLKGDVEIVNVKCNHELIEQLLLKKVIIQHTI